MRRSARSTTRFSFPRCASLRYTRRVMGTLYYGDKFGSVMCAFMEFLGPNDRVAPRLVELHRALKPTALPA